MSETSPTRPGGPVSRLEQHTAEGRDALLAATAHYLETRSRAFAYDELSDDVFVEEAFHGALATWRDAAIALKTVALELADETIRGIDRVRALPPD